MFYQGHTHQEKKVTGFHSTPVFKECENGMMHELRVSDRTVCRTALGHFHPERGFGGLPGSSGGSLLASQRLLHCQGPGCHCVAYSRLGHDPPPLFRRNNQSPLMLKLSTFEEFRIMKQCSRISTDQPQKGFQLATACCYDNDPCLHCSRFGICRSS
ncbi:hypothetical protein B0H66DRAFT_104141 [Apodospora peruviana]|uniref:Uncharacterized protein n=1 Tax=Apodospora peruviana TaxID=516989 RepID=A0AAE0HS27_9PEZI|nr:hypothetical protein B0H66DRAFT_104141 [Apodospora peruviana]